MANEYEMFMAGELEFLIGFETKKMREWTFINQIKYTKWTLKKFKTVDANPAKTPMRTSFQVNLDPKVKNC